MGLGMKALQGLEFPQKNYTQNPETLSAKPGSLQAKTWRKGQEL